MLNLTVKKIKKLEDRAALEKVLSPIKDDFNRFNKTMGESLKTNIKLLNMVWKYLLHQNGKKMRPILLLLSSGLCGNISDLSLKAATAIELLHTATLVHDDVVDNSLTRRGVPTINKIWKNKISILTGDFLLAQSLRATVDIQSFDVIEILAEAVKRMSQAEIHQIESSKVLEVDESNYFRIITDKTAVLFSASCELGALVANAVEEKRNALKLFGENVGIVFQIRDDLFGFEKNSRFTGKPQNNDLKNSMITLPLIYALKQSPKKEQRTILKLFKKELKKPDIKQIHSFVYEYKGIEYTKDKIAYFSEKARNNLSIFQDSPYRQGLLQFVEFSGMRKK